MGEWPKTNVGDRLWEKGASGMKGACGRSVLVGERRMWEKGSEKEMWEKGLSGRKAEKKEWEKGFSGRKAKNKSGRKAWALAQAWA